MSKKTNKKKPLTQPIKDRPIVPGTPLYRMLEMIAREVAQSLEPKTPPADAPDPPPR